MDECKWSSKWKEKINLAIENHEWEQIKENVMTILCVFMWFFDDAKLTTAGHQLPVCKEMLLKWNMEWQ